MKRFLVLSALMGSFVFANAQDANGLWRQLSPGATAEIGAPALSTDHYTAFTASEQNLRQYLETASTNPDRPIRIALPSPDGGYRTFRLWSTPMMAPELAAKFPAIRTYTAELEGNPRVTAKVDYTVYGFHAMVFDGDRSYIVNPYGQRPDGYYVASFKKDITRTANAYMNCELGDEVLETPRRITEAQRVSGTTRRNYRLALSCTGEYAVAVDGPTPTPAGVLSKMVTTMNRVNGVYEREVAVSMTLIANNNLLVYLDPVTDPFTNNSNGFGLLGENQANTNLIVGSAAYDIGHIFSTGGGGVASLGAVCQPGAKARGVTGSGSPMGDTYDIDYVAHEMGHQFGANHTFNASTGSCSGNGVTATAFEPGSGSTIMAYAGLCTGNNIQNNSHDYFHSASLEQITDFLVTIGGSGSCGTTSTSPNTNATLPSFAASYVIPSGTPFELIAPVATDPTADTAITYCWEERDLGNFGGTLASTTTVGPLFRSFPPKESRTRVFTDPFWLLAGVTSYAAEKLPTVSRSMSFGLTQRDYFQGWGTFNFPNDRINLQVESMSPFKVTYPLGGEVWTGGDFQNITWDLSNTTLPPVNCANVDIFMSVDGGYTWPYTLATGTPNDGNQTVQIPNVNASDYVRIKIKGSNNVFFALSPAESYLIRGTVSVPNAPLAESVNLSPIPAKNNLRVSVPSALGKVDFRLMNMLGQTVWTGTISGDQVLDASVWPRGVYQVAMQNASGFQQTKKLVLE